MNSLQEQKASLVSRLELKEKAHTTKYSKGVAVESSYQDSAKEIEGIYKELTEVCSQMGEYMPIRW
tara:strand:+ start:7495 stop:7692 length:198 start_codon:yes stop_codon:yes gene_type:complete